MAKVKVRRRPVLQDPEEVLTLAQRFLGRVKLHLKWLLLGLAAVVVVLGAWGISSYLKASREEKAAAAWAQVAPKINEASPNAETLTSLERFSRDYAGTRAAQEAELLRAHLLYQIQNYPEAAKAYASLITGRDPGWDTLAGESLSYCYEAMGNHEKAVEVLKTAQENIGGAFQKELWQRLGLLLEKAGKPQEAATYWRKLLEHPPNPGLTPYLQEKLAATEAAQKK